MINKQEIFDTVSKHLLAQGVKSQKIEIVDGMELPASCLYRGPNNTKCAIGVLISDKYIPECENNSPVFEAPVKDALALSLGVPYADVAENIEFFADLQDIHDRELPGNWRFSLKQFAKINGLTFFEDLDAPRHPESGE